VQISELSGPDRRIVGMRILAFIPVLFVASLALAQNKPDIPAEIQAAYKTYAKAVMAKDIHGVMASLSEDVVWKERPGDSKQRSEVRKEMEGFLKSIHPGAKFWFTFEKINVLGPLKAEAFVQTHYQEPGKPERKPPAGSPVYVWHDTWVKTRGRWQNCLGVVEKWPTPKE